jgi:hypothetical protein
MGILRFAELPEYIRDAYGDLVKGFGKPSWAFAPGPGATVEGCRAASFAQKQWRFCSDTKAEFPAMIDPLIQRARAATSSDEVVLALHDWSVLSFATHNSKTDRRTLTHEHDVGYDWATVLLVRATDGAPVAPVSVNLATAAQILTTEPGPVDDVVHVDQIKPRMDGVGALGLVPKVVHVIDREADSVGHWRAWIRAGHQALVRADDRVVWHNACARKLTEIAEELKDTGQLKAAGEARYHDRPAWRFVGEASVVLHRPAKRWEGGVQRKIPGEPVALRLVVVELRDAQNQVLSRWLLLTNVSADEADAATIGLWYYYRWRIETMHKLLKSAGWDVEDWRQQTGERLLRKLLLAFAACVEIWALQRRNDASSEALKALLMNLSGRQTKARRPITTSGLLAGLWILQQAATYLSRDGPDSPSEILKRHLPLFANYASQTT